MLDWKVTLLENKLYEYFLGRYKYDDKNSNDYNYMFNSNSPKKEFVDEFNKIIYMFDSFYYDNSKLVTSINSCDIAILNDVLEHIVKILNYAIDNGYILHSYIIEDFLFTYYKTIGINKKDNSEYKSIEKDFRYLMNKYNFNDFYNKFSDDCYKLYFNSISYGIEKDLYISPEVVYKIMNNTSGDCRSNLINLLIDNSHYYFIIVSYDTEIINHKSNYLKFINDVLCQEYGFSDVSSFFKIIVNSGCLNNDEIKNVINSYIIKTNSLCLKQIGKDDYFLGSLSEIESLKNSLVSIMNINMLDKVYKEKIHECIVNILSLKRFLLSDSEFINSHLHEYKASTSVSNEKVKEFIDEIKNNKFKIYGSSSIDFDKAIEESLNYYSKYALQSIISKYVINNKSQTYSTNDIYSTNYNYSFEKYYEDYGKKYTKNHHNKLLNKKNSGYYIEMLKYLSNTFYLRQNITISLLGDDNFNELIEQLNNESPCKLKNYYVLVVENILAVEVTINNLLKKNSCEVFDDMPKNLSLLFDIYKDNKNVRNGIMYLYYTLYEHSGPNLRNKIMHGTLINDDLKVPLLVSYSCLIFSSWLLYGI